MVGMIMAIEGLPGAHPIEGVLLIVEAVIILQGALLMVVGQEDTALDLDRILLMVAL